MLVKSSLERIDIHYKLRNIKMKMVKVVMAMMCCYCYIFFINIFFFKSCIYTYLFYSFLKVLHNKSLLFFIGKYYFTSQYRF